MNIANLFKKETKHSKEANVKALDKKQLESVSGGYGGGAAAASYAATGMVVDGNGTTTKQTQGNTFGE